MGSFSANRRACEVDPNGAWGGEHIRMEVTDSGADMNSTAPGKYFATLGA